MEIGKGNQAMMVAWGHIFNGDLSSDETEKTKSALLEYCKLDTLAMVKIFSVLSKMRFAS